VTIDFRGLFQQTKPDVVAVRAEERRIQHAQRDIYDSHRHRIFSVAFYMTGNEVHAEKILTDTFVQAFTVASKPDRHTVDQALLSQLRSRFNISPVATSGTVPGSGQPLEKNILRTDLEKALQHLPPVERLLFLLRDVEGYPLDEVSSLTEIPPEQASRILMSARIRLRSILADMQS
jgi:RNA polymerase sigma factor (sigma-70 family)